MSLRRQLQLGFILFTLIMTFGSWPLIDSASQIVQSFDLILNGINPMVTSLQEIQNNAGIVESEFISTAFLLQLQAARGDDLQSDIKGETGEFETAWVQLQESIRRYDQLSLDDEDNEFGENIKTSANAVHDSGQEILRLLENDSVDLGALTENFDRFETASDDLRIVLAQAFAHEEEELVEASQEASLIANDNVIANVVASIVFIIMVAVFGFVIYRNIIPHLRQLENSSRRIAEGDYRHRVSLKVKGELGSLAESFNSMADTMVKRNLELARLNQDLEFQIAEANLARERAENADRVKSAFLASMSHELRTPLNAIINFTKFVVKGVMGPVTDHQVETLNKTINSAKHLLALINDVLDMSKIESGSLNLFVEDDINVNDILNNVKGTAEGLLVDKKSVSLEMDVETLPLLRGDRQRILQIMLNIVSNACKFTEEGFIRIQARPCDNHIELVVKDTGPGIAPEDQALVFEPFKQTDTGLRQGSGTGLGMPISLKLVEAHGGQLRLESALGQGATFYVTLPVKSEMLVPVTV
jgi:signal transduction histidine kinase